MPFSSIPKLLQLLYLLLAVSAEATTQARSLNPAVTAIDISSSPNIGQNAGALMPRMHRGLGDLPVVKPRPTNAPAHHAIWDYRARCIGEQDKVYCEKFCWCPQPGTLLCNLLEPGLLTQLQLTKHTYDLTLQCMAICPC